MAKEALDNAEWLCSLSDSLKQDIMGKMERVEAADGDCLLREGQVVDKFIIVESGLLKRTKAAGADESPIELDQIGPGKVTGFLHVVGHQDDDQAFANVIADKNTTVWIVKGADFRTIMEDPKHSAEMMNMLTKILRQATKLVRATLREANGATSANAGVGKKVLKIMCYDATSWVREVRSASFSV